MSFKAVCWATIFLLSRIRFPSASHLRQYYIEKEHSIVSFHAFFEEKYTFHRIIPKAWTLILRNVNYINTDYMVPLFRELTPDWFIFTQFQRILRQKVKYVTYRMYLHHPFDLTYLTRFCSVPTPGINSGERSLRLLSVQSISTRHEIVL